MVGFATVATWEIVDDDVVSAVGLYRYQVDTDVAVTRLNEDGFPYVKRHYLDPFRWPFAASTANVMSDPSTLDLSVTSTLTTCPVATSR